jgi:hypothetical protein
MLVERGDQCDGRRMRAVSPASLKPASTRETERGSEMEKKGNQNSTKGGNLMKAITKFKSMRRSRTFLLSIVCAGAVTTLLGGCAESPYVTEYGTGYYPTGYYTPGYHDYYGNPYSYYGYGPPYYNHGDWY